LGLGWGGGGRGEWGKAGRRSAVHTYLVLRESGKLIAAVFLKSTFIMEGAEKSEWKRRFLADCGVILGEQTTSSLVFF
jgi:hypothetical protein